MRVYVPMGLADLAAHHAAGTVPPGQERLLAEDDSEEAEYAALVAAGEASAALLAARGEPGARRVVVVAEVGAGQEDGPLPLRRVVAVHADAAAGAAADDDLGWFATQEVPFLLDGAL